MREGKKQGDAIGVGWLVHWSLWQEGYPAIMLTDTALFRYEYYHHPQDTPDKLNYDAMARIVGGIEGVIEHLAEAPPSGDGELSVKG